MTIKQILYYYYCNHGCVLTMPDGTWQLHCACINSSGGWRGMGILGIFRTIEAGHLHFVGSGHFDLLITALISLNFLCINLFIYLFI